MKKLLPLPLLILFSYSLFAQNCPTSITVQAPSSVTEGESLLFTVNVNGGNSNITYNWSISAGTITSGQGTSAITVETAGIGGMSLTATVELSGLPRECSSTASSTVDILEAPKKIIEAKYTTPQAMNTLVQKFIQQSGLKNSDGKSGFIYVYRGATTTETQFKLINTVITKAFDKNGVLSYQYKIVDGGKKKAPFVEMYTMAQGAKEPAPSR